MPPPPSEHPCNDNVSAQGCRAANYNHLAGSRPEELEEEGGSQTSFLQTWKMLTFTFWLTDCRNVRSRGGGGGE